jgi:amidase
MAKEGTEPPGGDLRTGATDTVFTPAHKLAGEIQRGEVSSVEVVDAYLDQIARHNRQLNAVVTLDEDGARRRAREADASLARGEVWGPLHGVPVTIEDGHATAGIRSTWGGYPPLADHVPSEDSVATARLKAAGAIVLGKSNGPLIWGPDSMFGRTNNPWDLNRTPGESSGGPAAAVAAGLAPFDIGLDTVGSILYPSHCCGIFGMRPTEHRVSLKGAFFIDPIQKFHIMSVAGPMARSVEDLRLALRVIAGPDAQDPSVPPVPWREAPAPVVRDLRVAWASTLPGVAIVAETRAAIEGLAEELDRRGAQVRHNLPEVDFAEQYRFADEAFWLIAGTFGEGEQRAALDDYLTALHRREVLSLVWDRFFREWDVLLCPMHPAVAPRHDDAEVVVDGEPVAQEQAEIPYALSPVSGCPAVVIPLTSNRDGLPIGMQVVGRRWDDERVLAIAQLLSELTPGFQRPPNY